MRDKLRKKSHKNVVNYIRRFNKNIMNDEYLGINRFRIDMFCEDWYRYEDNSGGELRIVFKLIDNITNNSAYFIANNYNYKWEICKYMNDFMIRCSSGTAGHYPSLHYIAYDIHTICEYNGRKGLNRNTFIETINTYNWTHWNLF